MRHDTQVTSTSAAHGLDDDESSVVRRRDSAFTEALAMAARAALVLAQFSGDRVAVAVRGGKAHGGAVRVIEGVIAAIETQADGGERVRVVIAADTEQLIRLERIVRVSTCG